MKAAEARDLELELERRVSAQTAALTRANRRLRLAGEMKSRFLAATSHELRTPLNGILGFAALLLNDRSNPCTPAQAEGLRAIQGSGAHLLSLIHDLLDLVRLESGPRERACELFDCGALVGEVAQLLRPLADAKALTLKLEVPPGPVMLRTDRRGLRQIILNFVGNAVKFTVAGAVTIQLLAPVHECVEIVVADTGMGITPEQGRRLFRPYARLDTRCEGTGLGLYLSRQLARRLGGSVGFSSEPGAGSRFWVRVPTAMPLPGFPLHRGAGEVEHA